MQVKAVFDIGKTNKKFILFDEQYEIVFEQQITIDEIEDDDGDPCEDLDKLVKWMDRQFKDAVESDNFEISALNFSTYGATLVHLDEYGEVVTPLYNYLKPYPDDLQEFFYEKYGDKEQLSVDTASPPMGMMNSGLQLYRLKHRKASNFQRIRHSLHFPQYLSYRFTGEIGAECTSIGCHTAMWNFKENSYHDWLEKEGMMDLIPRVQPVKKTFEVSRDEMQFKTGMGIHDSSAALVPYLYLLDNPFILISTGTWSISLNPFNREPLTFDELQRDCLCYMNIYGDQVKAARLFLGNEYQHQKRKLSELFNRKSPEPEIELDPELLSGMIKGDQPDRRLVLETAGNSGPYPSKERGIWQIEAFSSYKEAYHQLMLDLVSIQADSIELAQGTEQPVDTLIVAGGFSQNDFFVKLLASCFPQKKVFTTTQPNASAFGAAMVLEDSHMSQKKSLKELLGLELQDPLNITGFETYNWNPTTTDHLGRSDR